MSILSKIYMNPAGEVILPVIELTSAAWPAQPIVLVRDYQDHTIVTEDNRTLVAMASGLGIALPKRDASGAQNITFALDGVRGEATRLLREANEMGVQINLTYREYLYSDLTDPVGDVFHFIVRNFAAEADQVEITAGLFDMIDMRWPRWIYDSNTAPCLEYM